MADRYWVGGSAIWGTTDTARWSTTSGGPGGASVPGPNDNVFFDQPGTYNVSMQGTLNVLNFTVSAGVVTFSTASASSLSVYGNWSTIAATVWSTQVPVTFVATTSKTIDANGMFINSPFTFNGAGGTWTLLSNFSFNTTASAPTGANAPTVTLTQGTLALSSFTLTCSIFNSSGTSARTINFGTGKIALTGITTATIWNTSTITNLTISGTPLVECSGGAGAVTKTINSGTLSEANAISFSFLDTGTSTYAFTAGNTVKNLVFNGAQTISNIAVSIFGTVTHSTTGGTTTFTAGANAWTFAATSGSYTIGNIAGFTYDFPWTFGSATSTATWTLSNNLTLGATRQLTLTNGTFDFNSKTLSAAGVTILTGTPSILNTGASSLSLSVPITHTSGTLTLPFDLTIASVSGYTLTAGVLSLGTYTLTTRAFSSSGTGVRTLNFGTGKIVLNGSTAATIWNTSTVTNLTVSGTSLVECIGGGTGITKTINTGALSEANAINFSFLETTGSVTYTFTAANVFKNLIFNGAQTVSNIAITIYGTITHLTTNGTTTFTAGANAWTFAATSGSYLINNIAGFTYDFPWTFGSAASTATWTLTANLIIGATRTTTLTTGTLALSSFTLSTGLFSSSGTGVRTLDFGTGKISLTYTSVNTSATIWTTATVTNLTISGTSLVECSGGGGTTTPITKTINTGALSEANAINFSLLETTGTAAQKIYAFTAGNTVKNLIINGVQTLSNIAITIYGNITHSTSNGATTFTAGANAWTFGATSGSYSLGYITGFTYDFPWTFGSAAASTATWTLPSNLTLGATRQLSLANGTFDFNNKTLSAGGITIVTGTPTIANTGAASFTTTLPITHTSGSLTLPFDITTSSAAGYTLTAGTLALGTYTLTTRVFSSSGTGVRTLNFGTGKIVLNGSVTATIWTTSTVTNLTVSGTPLVECIGGGTGVTKGISTGALSEANSISFSFLETSGTATYLFTTNSAFRNLTFNGVQTISNVAITIYGNFTHSTTNGTTTFTGGLNAWTFAATSGSYSLGYITGFTYDWPWTFGSAASTATWTLPSNLTLGASRALTLVNGTLDLNNKTFSAASVIISTGTPTIANTGGSATLSLTMPITHTSGNFTLPFNITTAGIYTFTAGNLNLNDFILTSLTFVSSGSGVRTLAFGTSGQITLTGNNATILDITTATNFSTTGNVYINSTYTGSTGTRIFVTGFTEAQASAGYNVSTSGTSGIVISPSATDSVALTGGFNTIDLTGFTGTLTNTARTIYANLIIPVSGGTFTAGANATTFGGTGTETITTNGRTLDFPITFSGVGGTFQLLDNLTVGSTRLVTLSNGTLDLNNLTLTTGLFNSSGSTSRTLAFGTGQLVLTGNNATIFDITTATNFTTTGTVYINSTYTGSTGTRLFSTGFTEAQAVQYNVATSGTTGIVLSPAATDRVDLQGNYNSVNLTGFIGTFGTAVRTIYGDFTLPSGGTIVAGTSTTTFAATSGTKTITTNGRTLDFPITINGAGGTFQLQDNFLQGTTRAFTHTNGTIDLNGRTLTVGTTYTTAAGTKNLTFNGGTLVCPAASVTSFNNAVPAGFTTTAGSGTGTISMTAATAKTFVGGSIVYDCDIDNGGAGALTITGTNTFNRIKSSYADTTANTTILLPGSDTTVISGITGGSAANKLLGFGSAANTRANVVIYDTDVQTASFLQTNSVAFIVSELNRSTDSSVFFDGTGDYLIIGAANLTASSTGKTPLAVGTGDFTIEAWFETSTISSAAAVIFKHYGSPGTNDILEIRLVNNTVTIRFRVNGGVEQVITSGTIVADQWYHIAFVRSSGVITGYLNGTSFGTASFNSNLATTLTITTIGCDQIGTSNFTGLISNFRFVKGTAVYTSAFTPPRSALTAITNTSLLTCQDTTFVDDGPNNFTITAVGNSTVSRESPFYDFAGGTTPWKWYLANSVNNGDTLGAVFQRYNIGAPILYYIKSGTTFRVPYDWDSSNNSVHIWGGGGGSSGSYVVSASGNRLGSAGGGGGGYTQVLNFSSTPGSSVTYSIGAGGTAGGAGFSIGGDGGTTTFAGVYTANGGGGSTISTTTTTGGIGGIGATANGGVGGLGGGAAGSANNSSGGGGGGSGGPNGVGRNGGTGTIAANPSGTAGGGGGGSGGGTNGTNAVLGTPGVGGNNFVGTRSGGNGGLGTVNGGTLGGIERGRVTYEIANSAGGAGGGGGGGAFGPGVNDPLSIGGGAGGSGATDANYQQAGTVGQSGGIIILYYPKATNMLMLLQ